VTEQRESEPRRCLPVEQWPARDREAWEAAHRRGGLLDDDGLAANWASATTGLIAAGYGRYLSFVASTEGLDPCEEPATRITKPRIEAYVAELQRLNSSSTVAARLLQLVRAAAVMSPKTDWRWLRRIRARLVPSADLLDLAFKLMQRAEAELGAKPHQRALWFRDGLMIGMLCACAPRARNVAGTFIGTNLQRRGELWWACYGSHETKNKRPLELPLPEFLTAPIERYLADYGPVLAGRGIVPSTKSSDAFWLSHRGLPLTAKEVGKRITAVTRRELGKPVNPHLFRKMIPTELAIHDPEHVRVAQPLLGHADYRTTEQAYNLGRALDAARRHQQVLRSIRTPRAG
jgi:site-specific recombinase XerD